MPCGADHKPGLMRERRRVLGAGGRVEWQRCWRVISGGSDDDSGRRTGLAVSRSFGDIEFKEPRLCAPAPQQDTLAATDVHKSWMFLRAYGCGRHVFTDRSLYMLQVFIGLAPAPRRGGYLFFYSR